MSSLYKSGSLLLASAIVSVAVVAHGVYLSCGLPTGSYSTANQSKRERLSEIKRAIDAEIGTPHADSLAQCRHIAFGAKPCGGPRMYLVYSTARTDEQRLKRLVSEYNALDKKINEEEGLSSDCAAVMEPKLVLAGGVCVGKRK
jgi:hypothetical protein